MSEKRFIPIFDGFDKRVVGAKDNGKIISFMDMFDKLNEQDKRIKELEKEKYRLNSKVKRLIDELANCYEKLGW